MRIKRAAIVPIIAVGAGARENCQNPAIAGVRQEIEFRAPDGEGTDFAPFAVFFAILKSDPDRQGRMAIGFIRIDQVKQDPNKQESQKG